MRASAASCVCRGSFFSARKLVRKFRIPADGNPLRSGGNIVTRHAFAQVTRVRIKTRRREDAPRGVLVFPKLFTNTYHRESNSRPDVFPSLWSAYESLHLWIEWHKVTNAAEQHTRQHTEVRLARITYVTFLFFLFFPLIFGVFQQHRWTQCNTRTHIKNYYITANPSV